MGFGNALCIDNSIYNEYEPYLNELINKYLEDKDDESYKYSTIFNVWENALMNMINDKKTF